MEVSEVRSILETDRVWSAYALADLFPPYLDQAEWRWQTNAVVLCYRGFSPPILFAHGDPEGVGVLLHDIPAGTYQYGLLATHRLLIQDRWRSLKETRMWRMVLPPGVRLPPPTDPVTPLVPADLPALEILYDDASDPPDAFHPSQLDDGAFFGVWDGPRLIAVAGTHVVSVDAGVAAIGNVYTRADRRGRGLGRRTTAAVTAELRRRGLPTIVLNVALDNEPALRVYRALGFMPFCGYYEGVADLGPARTSTKET